MEYQDIFCDHCGSDLDVTCVGGSDLALCPSCARLHEYDVSMRRYWRRHAAATQRQVRNAYRQPVTAGELDMVA